MPTSEITTLLGNLFNDFGWPAMLDSELGCFVVPYEGRTGSWTCLAYPIEDEHQFVFYSVAPVFADDEHLAAAAEFITRANSGLILGNFELDYDTGEIRYKTSIDVEGEALTPALASHVVHSNVQGLARYLPGLMMVLDDAVSPAVAIARVED